MLKFFIDKEFRKDLEFSEKIYTFFFSPSCGPCREIYSQVEDFGKNTDNLVYFIHEEEGKELQEQLNVTAYPSMVLIQDKKITRAGLGAEEVLNIINGKSDN